MVTHSAPEGHLFTLEQSDRTQFCPIILYGGWHLHSNVLHSEKNVERIVKTTLQYISINIIIKRCIKMVTIYVV